MNFDMTRRDFMKQAAVISAIGVAPQFLTQTAWGASQSINGFKDDRVLVVAQLGGGNDGLNTLVPYGHDAYYNARPKIGIREDRVLPLNDEIGFNNRFVDFMRLYDDGQLAIIQGVGYPNPDRSHFRSMEIWETASKSDEYLSSGWIGRYFDHHCSGTAQPQVGVALGNARPQAFDGASGLGVAFENPSTFGWQPGQGGDTEENFARINRASGGGDDTIDFLRHVTSSAIMSSRDVKQAAASSTSSNGDRRRAMGPALSAIAGLIKAELATRIYYVSVSGFDTHADQSGPHDALLQRVGRALADFQATLREDGTAHRVTTMVFSEFGRRVVENKSGGTDHGTAAPMFLIGDNVKPGLHGTHPSLTKLDNGDLRHTTDFRSVYATVLKDWFNVKPETVLGGKFPALDLIV